LTWSHRSNYSERKLDSRGVKRYRGYREKDKEVRERGRKEV